MSNLQHKRFPVGPLQVFGPFSDDNELLIEAAKLLTAGVNAAIADGAESVDIMWHNIPTERDNPFGKLGSFIVTGYRQRDPNPATSS